MDVNNLIEKYYRRDSELYDILVNHSKAVADKALLIADNHPELNADRQFLYEASMLHDIGVFMTNAPEIQCFGDRPYICHGVLGADLVRKEGYSRHALVCERHTGAGLKQEEVIKQKLPIPPRDYMPISIEEQIICFSDCFFSKTNLNEEKTVEKLLKKFEKRGERSVLQIKEWCRMFL
ncbi:MULTISPECIES: HD domain-containing protein [unclassified Dysgonomonas]|uniref:HD domain-containing protein n=1 Tax=unclassified Dysgonomonas TaxID=2630389 RepID=UPI0024749E55|nr:MULTISPECIES: HD domain-containing protein [unclassified Dysgonomonas]